MLSARIAFSLRHPITAMVYTASHSPIYYVGQPTVLRDAQSAMWIKSSSILVSGCSVRLVALYSPSATQTMDTLPYKPTQSRRSMSPSPSPPPSTTSSDVPTAVSTLLGLTKQLQEVLRLWSKRQVNEGQVSDAFVLVGMQFNATVNAFSRHHIDMR